MSHSLRSYLHEHILVITLNADFCRRDELIQIGFEALRRLNAAVGELTLIFDLVAAPLDYTALFHLVNFGARGDTPIFHHPNVGRLIFVTQSELIELGAKTLDSPIYGNLSIPVFPTLDQAMHYARSL
ncbi:MAG TPA: hypothetical protein VHP83_07285 [Aggregatilineaceae bacterium]|nr:hypothetical protein [Aggregatilineaceae bacterium]